MADVKYPKSIVILSTVTGYGIYDKQEQSFIGLKSDKHKWDSVTKTVVIIESKQCKVIWDKPAHAKSAFKLHTGTDIKDVSDRYEVRSKI